MRRAACEAGEQELVAGNACGIGGGEVIEPAPEPEPVPEPEPEPELMSGLDAGTSIAADKTVMLRATPVVSTFRALSAASRSMSVCAAAGMRWARVSWRWRTVLCRLSAGASCKADCGNFELEIRHTSDDCRDGGQCSPCSPPGATVNACSCPF